MKSTLILIVTLLTFTSHVYTQPKSGSAAAATCFEGTVQFADALASKVKSGGTLFVYVREMDREQGPPTAVVSIKKPSYPQKFKLCPSDQMIQSSASKALDGRYRVYARHSPTGKAMVQDGFIGVNAGDGNIGFRSVDAVTVVIDRNLEKSK